MSAAVAARPCNKCGREFVQTPGRAKRGNWTCRSCDNSAVKARHDAIRNAGGKVPRYGDAKQINEREHSYRQRSEVRQRRAAAMSRYAKDPALRIRHEARWQVRRAIASGAMVRSPCEVCGHEPAHGHHDDYSKPLDVRWLCPTHHREHHARCGGAQ